ncbi:ABC transporter ATP-binding protein [Poseidonibacter parvus]|uniref:ABC transporter ATP-binding protein n=1 Tax=Poseidonibacter parvus TaxID=1850254 RepID=A0A1P8KPM7_9BACT|nr:ABC transporter ATP-binding protein [Poseidonibacter parvus]APW66500.1 ABC transporter ATP-binding protein [Poseidonibacter parvus]
MIELINATKYYETNIGKNYILDDVTFTIPSDKSIAILGSNGAGKSTLLRMLGGIDFPNKGTIRSKKRFSWPMGLSSGFQASMTGRQNVKFVCRIYGKDDNHMKEAIEYVNEFSGLGVYFDMPLKTYSSGMRSKLSFGMSLFFDFDYMLIDEVLAVGDPKFRNKAKDRLMEKIKKSNAIIVSHQMPILKEVCDVGIYLDSGKIQYFEDVQEAIDCYQK